MSFASVSGMGVSPGIAIGEPVVHLAKPIAVLRISVPEERLEEEVARFRKAIEKTIDRITVNQERARRRMGEEYAAIFEAHRLIADDPTLLERVEELIRNRKVNAEWAFDHVVSSFLEQFKGLGDAYLAERRLDLLDVATQVLNLLQGYDFGKLEDLDRPVLLVADDLPPSQAVQLPLDHVLGFVLETGGATSHTTIIARSLGIPAVVGAHGACQAALEARLAVVDALEGRVVFEPDPAEIAEFESRRQEYAGQRAHLAQLVSEPSVTRDGHRVALLANIDLPAEVAEAVQWDAEGVGLYRSEFLYMRFAPGLPSEENHFEHYRDLVKRAGGRPVVIRTFDLGGKKLAREVMGNQEANPVLGLRGIRLCLRHRDFFAPQLRALLRVCAEFPQGQVRIMLPLISGLEEIRLARSLVRKYSRNLRADGHKIPDHVPLGAMVEVPSAALISQRLAREVDFLSIGTNDLTQYTLAVDRANEMVADLYRPSHPAILRLISEIVQAGDGAGIDVSMCGETAADPLMVPVLVGLGLRKLSMSPQALPVVRNLVRHLSYREAAHIARSALDLSTAREVEEYLLERLAILFAKIKIHV